MINRYLILTFLFCLCVLYGKSFHIVGGDITYKCLGGNKYQITMIIYRDCGGQGADFDSPANIAVYNDTLFANLEVLPTGITEIPADIYDPCFSVPTGVCVQKGYYTTTITLPANSKGYTISYQRCCRNSSLRNIVVPEKVGTTITTNIPGSLQAGCNDSPVFKQAPPLAICLGSDFQFDHGATDADGDSLVYKFCDPYTGGSDAIMVPGPPNSIMPIPATKPPYQMVPWSAGYSANNPFNIVTPFQIDAITGTITGIPRQLGQYLYGVCVEEYRNGVKIGETRREFQVNIVACESNTEALFDAPEKCSGMELSFLNNSITARTFEWDFDIGNPGVQTSTNRDPIITFTDTGSYRVRLIANPQYDCADTIEKLVQVYPKIKPEILGERYACLSNPRFQFTASGEFAPYTQIYWDYPGNVGIPSDTGLVSDTIFVSAVGKFDVTLSMQHAVCTNSVTEPIEVLSNPQLKYASRNTTGCSPLLVQMENLSEAETELITQWTFNGLLKNSSTSTNPQERWRIDKPGNYTISLITYTKDKCLDTLGPVDFIIQVYESPSAGFYLSDTVVSIFNPEIEVLSNSKNASDCELYVGKPIAEKGCSGLFSFEKPGTYKLSQIVTNKSGCTDTLSKNVVVENEYAFFAPNSFTPNTDGRNEIFRPVVIGSKDYELLIYDRWGHIIYTATNPKEGWPGLDERTGEQAPVGVYLFKAKVLDFSDEYHFYTGEINLFR